MSNRSFIQGFSKLSQEEKNRWIANLTENPEEFLQTLQQHLHPNSTVQEHYFSFSENTLSNHFLPFGVAPNFLINGDTYHVPMVIEESSVVAAASSAAKFWYSRGGFKTSVVSTIKTGQVHFFANHGNGILKKILESNKERLIEGVSTLTQSMQKRGGGLLNIELVHKPLIKPDYYQLNVSFNTADAMGANFINSVLEQLAKDWKLIVDANDVSKTPDQYCTILMSILSNYTPESLVNCKVSCPINELENGIAGSDAHEFSERFVDAVNIANQDVNRAVTHNKGIMNGADAVVLATGNDFRAVEANAHAWAARDGQYRSLSIASINDGEFEFSLSMPLALGTVGGIAGIHPLVKYAFEILDKPNAHQLMQIVAAAGLANNFSAVKSLVTSGIQKGHMKMHLGNILQQLGANQEESKLTKEHFHHNAVSFSGVKLFLETLRNN